MNRHNSATQDKLGKQMALAALAAGLLPCVVSTSAQEAKPAAAGPDKAPFNTAAANKSSKPAEEKNVSGIMDNSFLIEEAYNQEPGIVQHILTGFYGVNKMGGPDDQAFNLSFTQEWPVLSQTHQFSYTVPYSLVDSGGQRDNGIGDILLNYRYQAYFDEPNLRAFAPRFSLVLPTGDVDRGFGDDTLGFQWNLPFSTAIGDKWFAHANAGLTFLPDAGPKPRHDLLHYNLGASTIYAATSDLHFMLEWVGSWNDQFDVTAGSSHEFESLIMPGVRKAFNFENGSQWVVGLGVPIGLTGSAPDIGVFLYLSFEHGLGKSK